MNWIRAGALAAVVAIAGCGSQDSLTAQEFVEQVSREGVEVRLGEPLVTDEEGKELYGIELDRLAGPQVDSHGDPIRTGGSVAVFDDVGDADAELAACRRTADLLCYQLDNVVVALEGGGLETRQLGVAMQRLASDQ